MEVGLDDHWPLSYEQELSPEARKRSSTHRDKDYLKKESSYDPCSIYLYSLLSLQSWSCFQKSHWQKFQGRISTLSSLTVTIFLIPEFEQCKVLCKLRAPGIKSWWFCILVNSEWTVRILGVECLLAWTAAACLPAVPCTFSVRMNLLIEVLLRQLLCPLNTWLKKRTGQPF